MHTRTRSDHVRIDCFAILVDVANPLAEHIRHRLGVGRGLHNERRGGGSCCLAGCERRHRPDCNRSGGHLRGRWRDRGLRRGRLSGLRGLCLRERQRRNHRANKNNSCSSHGFPFIELTFHGCFATCVPFGCLDRPLTQRRKLRQQQGKDPAVGWFWQEADKITRNACNSCGIPNGTLQL